jgi:hypothetical protein
MSLKVLQALLPIELLITHGAKQTEKSDRKLWSGSVGMIHYVLPLPWSNTRAEKTSFSFSMSLLKLHMHDHSV